MCAENGKAKQQVKTRSTGGFKTKHRIHSLNDTEIQALSKRFENSVKPVVNRVMVSASHLVMLNTLAQLSYKVVCCGKAEICWTMQREI
ncbi:uncharacterized protein LOC111684889 [Lucilia cuprina]|uniref:uncharacterized protein LOC111684889 n=1 Tax=Lucilia cuprina TaxID=7375 RepID=UPI001F05BB92|nr:uncharacterized protein LOC111684889 [Lucilia cuprina]XP_046807088.1 uncharacterized protein LOC111684889 [Lucilia cuprina]XP_046807089.1 uncharacterized protein LOC111684889 [Lucilia cuprina]XP_046807090.1 uncharacterized protein LOC111684889 [Lucilia cuprina]XP_046807091.1 uncharacterized protein LOC111684889 [Lucilia cuprina]XP_046807092.1 uncharacterized protein LOC111684889 [Lucilia cuprina]XP_046807093.1 uncharacterized protein LOC111684889 [Lucilia cuprina]XP_046807094.1 uncharacte